MMIQKPIIEDSKAIINRYLNSIKKDQKSKRTFYLGFFRYINNQYFPLLSNEEINIFKSEYIDLVNQLFPEL